MKIVGGEWSNWSGGVKSHPKLVAAPKDEVDLAALVRNGAAPIRVPGTGHSFTPICASDGTLIDLSAFRGLRGVDKERQVVALAAATPLWEVGPLIHPSGLGLKNQGDIDRQTLGGVVGTGTHGTGPTLGSFSADVVGFRIVLASGEVLHCSPTESSEIFEAGRLSLGMLGVMTEISMQARPAYKLVDKEFLLPIDELFARLDELVTNNRHFEFFWFPYADRAVCKTLNETNEEAPAPRESNAMQARGESVSSDQRLFGWINEILSYASFLVPPAHRLFSSLMPASGKVRWSHEMFPSPRTTRFNEMEYAVPIEQGPQCLRELVAAIRGKRINTGFPIEYRTVAADDVWLSPFYRRPSATLAVHQYHRVDTSKLFETCEAIFRRYDGRPHWGKRHTRAGNELLALYPEFGRFRALRKKLDPEGKFLNPYLAGLFD